MVETEIKDLITEARELCKNVAQGPWFNFGDWLIHTEQHTDEHGIPHENVIGSVKPKNATFIARSRTLVPELCDALEKAQAEIERLEDVNRALENDIYNCEMNLSHLSELVLRWIPVAERLPKHSGFVLVITDNGACEPFVGWMRNDKVWFANGFCIVNNVTHWMPLLDPPKGE